MRRTDMEAPDKLYIGRRNYGPLIGGWKSQPFTSKEIESIEYIRKDALLEWLENKIKISDGGFVNGLVCLAYRDVIEHLNGM